MCSSSIKFRNRFLQASNNGMSYDCKFIVGSENVVVEGHKFLFSVASEVFRAMFYGELKEDNSVKIEDLDSKGFESMTYFIYTGEVHFTSAIHALSTYIAARKYLIPELTKECIKYIQEKIEPSEVLEFYEYCERNNIPEFDELCFRIIEEKTDEVVKSEYFPTVKIETIQLILKSRSLKLKSEIEVFDLFEKWALAEADREQISEGELASSFKYLKKYIRFLTISKKEFTSRIEQSLLLTQAEKRAIECNLLESDSKPMPETLSVIQQHRIFASTVTTWEKYAHTHNFVVSLHPDIDCSCSCNTISYGFYLNIGLTIQHNHLCLFVQPQEINRKYRQYGGGLYNLRSKLIVFAVDGCNDLTIRNECKILQKGHPGQSEILVIEIPLKNLDEKYYLKRTNKAVSIQLRYAVDRIAE